jgi:tRNA A-37 threonylcarbamoyl transferase component Bud32
MTVSTQLLPPRYRLPRRIGRGAMGDIYVATDEVLGRDVAVKVLAERYAQDEAIRARFTREALAAARVSGEPHTVTIFDVGEHERRPFIVMEYLPGGSLADRLLPGGVTPGEALDWLDDAAVALDAAHERGVVHRDVKPANLLLDGAGRVHVADFGIASAAGMDAMTQPGTVLGTVGYLSPEQARGERATAASDRYALGVVAYELLTGARPFHRDSPTAEAGAHVNDPVPPVRGSRGDLPPELDAVFARALAKDPAARYSTCGELVAELRHALDDAAGGTRVRPMPAATAATTPLHRTRSRWPVLAALALVALLGAGVALAVLTSGGDEQQAQPRTIVRTVTAQGEPSVKTVTEPAPTTQPTTQPATQPTTQPATQPPAQASTAQAPAPASGSQLNDSGYAKMRAGDYQGALPLLEQSVQQLQGTGSITEAYADYNLAYTRFKLGNCDGVAALLDRSEAVQGHRTEITHLRNDVRRSC